MPDDELPSPEHAATPGVPDDVVDAVGKLTEALETCERARGHLYSFHQLTGSADIQLGEAVQALREAGKADAVERIERELLGRNVLAGRWTFQVVEEYDDGYWSLFRDLERDVRDHLVGGRRHIYEARMKERERSIGEPGHEATPGDVGPGA